MQKPKGPRNLKRHGFTNALWRLTERDNAREAAKARREEKDLMAKRSNEFVEFEAFTQTISEAELGDLIREYIAESNHGSWEGFTRADLTGIRRMLGDIRIFHSNRS